MKIKINVFLGLYFLFMIVSIIQSCCNNDIKISSKGFASAWELKTKDKLIEIDTIKDEFVLGFFFQDSIIAYNGVNTINSCYATSCGESFLNEIEENSISLTIDIPIIFKGDTLVKGTNLLAIQDSGIETNSSNHGFVKFTFYKDFLENTKFLNDSATFKFNAKTDDGIMLTSEINLKTNK